MVAPGAGRADGTSTQSTLPASEGGEPRTAAAETVREATLADVERIDSLTLEDFAADFSRVTVPEGPLSDQQIQSVAENFLEVLRGS
jgi:hypothetical protein